MMASLASRTATHPDPSVPFWPMATAASAPSVPARLSDGQIEDSLVAVPEWSLVGETIQRTYQFEDFVTSMKFVNQCASAAESAQHHPDILIRYSRVTLTLATHDAGGITTKDFTLAKQCDTFAAAYPAPKTKVKIKK